MPIAPHYLHIGRASDLQDSRERFWYRAFEIMPGAFMWGTFGLAILGAWLFPIWTAFFIIIFVIYWFVRLFYFSFHLRASYKAMRQNEKTDWIAQLEGLRPHEYTLPTHSWKDLYHLVFIPTYREPLAILRSTIASVAENTYPKGKMILVLGVEENEGEEGIAKARALQQEFEGTFFRFLVTVHPAGLPGEIPGKASNETWAAKEAKSKIIDSLGISYEHIIVTSLDADTAVYPQYFARLTYVFLTSEKPLRSSFQPIPLFLNNIRQAPALSRVFSFNSTFWHLMNQSRPEKLITFSSHSMSFHSLVDVGFKQPNVVSDDSRIFWQCFLKYDGDYRTIPLNYPVSMDANAAPTLRQTMKNMYKQQRRWAYGVADVPFFLFGFMKNPAIPWHKRISPGWEVFFGFWSWATASVLILLLGWLPLVLGGPGFSQALISYHLPRLVSLVLRIGLVGLIGSIYLSFLLFPVRVADRGYRGVFFFAAQWALLPVTMLFASIPAIEAQTRLMTGRYLGFWVTPKFREEYDSREAAQEQQPAAGTKIQ